MLNFRDRAIFAACGLLCLATGLAATRARGAGLEGFTEPYRKIDVGPAEPGLLGHLNVKEGDAVRAGEELGTLECDVLHVSLEIAQATWQSQGRINSATAECDLHRVRLDKLTELLAQGHASHEEVDRERTELAVAQANLQSAQEQQAVDRLECKKIATMIERRKFRSPIDGVVTRIYKDEQELVAGNASTVLTVVQLNPLRVTFSVPTARGLAMKVGQTLPLVLPETSEKVVGTVELISPVTDAESGTVRVKMLIANPRGAYRSGVRCALDDGETDPRPTAAKSPYPIDPTPEIGAAQ